MSSSTLVLAAAGSAGSAPGARHRRLLQPWWWPLLDPPAVPPKGPTINFCFNLGGGHYRTHRQCPSGDPPSMSPSTSVVAAAGSTDSAP
jgi:hypothetical protein